MTLHSGTVSRLQNFTNVLHTESFHSLQNPAWQNWSQST